MLVTHLRWVIGYWFIVGASLLPCRAQNPAPPQQIDSLESYLKTHSPTDTHYVRALFRYGTKLTYERGEYDKALSVAREAESWAQKLNWGMGLHQSHRVLGLAYYHKADLHQALNYFQ